MSRVTHFHSLRVTFGTNLIASGSDLKTAQELFGHSAPTMIPGVYAKVLCGSQASAIAWLPSYDRVSGETPRATGTRDTESRAGGTIAKIAQDRMQEPALAVHDGAPNGGGRDGGVVVAGRATPWCGCELLLQTPVPGETSALRALNFNAVFNRGQSAQVVSTRAAGEIIITESRPVRRSHDWPPVLTANPMRPNAREHPQVRIIPRRNA
jgi:hypothetical protein